MFSASIILAIGSSPGAKQWIGFVIFRFLCLLLLGISWVKVETGNEPLSGSLHLTTCTTDVNIQHYRCQHTAQKPIGPEIRFVSTQGSSLHGKDCASCLSEKHQGSLPLQLNGGSAIEINSSRCHPTIRAHFSVVNWTLRNRQVAIARLHSLSIPFLFPIYVSMQPVQFVFLLLFPWRNLYSFIWVLAQTSLLGGMSNGKANKCRKRSSTMVIIG